MAHDGGVYMNEVMDNVLKTIRENYDHGKGPNETEYNEIVNSLGGNMKDTDFSKAALMKMGALEEFNAGKRNRKHYKITDAWFKKVKV